MQLKHDPHSAELKEKMHISTEGPHTYASVSQSFRGAQETGVNGEGELEEENHEIPGERDNYSDGLT